MMEDLLKEAMLSLDDYLNAGSKEERKKASEKAKILYKKYYGKDYINRNEREDNSTALKTCGKCKGEIKRMHPSATNGIIYCEKCLGFCPDCGCVLYDEDKECRVCLLRWSNLMSQ